MQMIGEVRAQVGTVTPKEAADAVGRDAAIVDVREPEEWQHGHINGVAPGAAWAAGVLRGPDEPRHKAELDRHRRTIVLCASGARASLVAFTLKSMGYEDVAILDGGLKGWTKAGLPTNEYAYSGI